MCRQQGHKEQSLLLVETELPQCAAAGTESTLHSSCITISILSSSWSRNSNLRSVTLLFTKGNVINIFKKRNNYLIAFLKPNSEVISKPSFYALFYCQFPRAILFLATVPNREAGKYFTMITCQDYFRSPTHIRKITIMHS